MKTLLFALFLVPIIGNSQKNKSAIKLSYKDAIENFLKNLSKSFTPKNEIIYLVHIDEANAKNLPKLVNGYHLKFISPENIDSVLKNKFDSKVYEIVTTKFENSSHLIHFLPVINSKGGIERDFDNMCSLFYKQHGENQKFIFEQIQCGIRALK